MQEKPSENFDRLAANGGWFRRAEMPGFTAGRDAGRYWVASAQRPAGLYLVVERGERGVGQKLSFRQHANHRSVVRA